VSGNIDSSIYNSVRGVVHACRASTSSSDTGTECCAYFGLACSTTIDVEGTASEHTCSYDQGASSEKFFAFCY